MVCRVKQRGSVKHTRFLYFPCQIQRTRQISGMSPPCLYVTGHSCLPKAEQISGMSPPCLYVTGHSCLPKAGQISGMSPPHLLYDNPLPAILHTLYAVMLIVRRPSPVLLTAVTPVIRRPSAMLMTAANPRRYIVKPLPCGRNPGSSTVKSTLQIKAIPSPHTPPFNSLIF